MPLDPARVLSAYLRAQAYRAPNPEPEPEHAATAGGEQPPAAAPAATPEPPDPAGLPHAPPPTAEAGLAAPSGAQRRPGLFARLLLYVRQG
ncbi:hypothetical protein ACSNOH_35150 [Streptomyces sp. URMC 127]|uniref:hypothetical protein n=1 Tax=Streptomyces sp. URMC 127 TaxID=3423402 RepID=UPI003F19D772